MISASTKPPIPPARIAGTTTAGFPLAKNCDHGHSAAASSTTSSRNDLLIVPCSVMASPATLARGRPEKVLSLRPGLPLRASQVLSSIVKFPSALRRRLLLVVLDHRIGRMVVNRFEILALDHIRRDAILAVEPHGYVAHDVFDEFRVVVGMLGDILFVRPLEDAVELAGGFLLRELDQLLDPDVLLQPRLDGHVRALAVRAALRDLLRTGTQAGDRDHDLDPGVGLAAADLADQRGLVIHQALDARDRRALHDEERKRHLDMTGIGVEPRSHLAEHRSERVDRDLALVMQDLDEARHMSALEVMRQVHVHIERSHRVLLAGGTVLDLDRMADVLDTDPVDRDAAGIRARLHVLDGYDVLGSRLGSDVHGFTYRRSIWADAARCGQSGDGSGQLQGGDCRAPTLNGRGDACQVESRRGAPLLAATVLGEALGDAH